MKSYDKPRLQMKKQRHHFDISQSYGFFPVVMYDVRVQP